MPCSTFRISLLCLFSFAALSLGPASAFAGLLQSAELRFKIHGLPDGVITGVGVTGQALNSTSVAIDAGNGLAGVTTQTSCAPHLDLFGNDAGSFTGASPGAIGGDLRLFGDWAPFGVSKQTFTFPAFDFGISTSDMHNGHHHSAWPWTVGTTSVTSLTLATASGGTTTGTVTGMGANNLTPLGSGTLVMVAPIYLESTYPDFVPTGVIAELTLVFTPEPEPAAMLAAGCALLFALAGRRSRGKRNVRSS
jgi:hypothetical protein